MLNRIDDLMRSMRQVSNDIAHDLRTPDAARQRLEHARRRAQTTEELHEALALHRQVDSILETFGAPLRIAQIEAAAGPSESRRSTSLSFSPRSSMISPRRPRIMVKALVAEIDKGLRISGDPELLTQMVVNLVDNAIRHSPRERASASKQSRRRQPEARRRGQRPWHSSRERETYCGRSIGWKRAARPKAVGWFELGGGDCKRHHAKLSLGDNSPGLRVRSVISRSGVSVANVTKSQSSGNTTIISAGAGAPDFAEIAPHCICSGG